MAGNKHRPLPRDGYVASTAKRLGEERFFSEAFVVFHYISVIFRVFCLVIKRIFVYLQTIKGDDTISYPVPIEANEL